MALLKDQPISCLSEWMAYDSKLSILSEQETTSIDSKSRLAQNEIETQVISFLLRHSGSSDSAARQLTSKVTVTEALSRWHSMLTLALFYADLAALQNSSLHRDQSRYYEIKAEAAKEQLFDTGLGIVNLPIPKAPIPLVVSTPGANPERLLRGRIRFANSDGVVGAPSDEFLLDMTDGESISISVGSLPPDCSGWLLFLGETSEALFMATPAALSAATTLTITGSMPSPADPVLIRDAQPADRFIRYSTELWR